MGITKILIATHNPGKFKEISQALLKLLNRDVKIVSLQDIGINKQPKETGTTFQENSQLKARYYGDLTQLPTISDDGGLLIEALGGAPGVKSRRWLGRDAEDHELIAYTLKRLKSIPQKKRAVYFETVITYYNPKTNYIAFEMGRIKGHIVDKVYEHYTKGYPYRAIILLDVYNKYYDELSVEEHAAVNHRIIALRRLLPKIQKRLIE